MPESTLLQLVPLNSIRTDGDTCFRERVDGDTVRRYAEMMEAGATFPPLAVFRDGDDFWLADGHYRYRACVLLDRDTVEVEMHTGTLREAHVYALGANSSHGRPHTPDERRRKICKCFDDEEWGQLSNRKIAEMVGVSHTSVNEVKRAWDQMSLDEQIRIVDGESSLARMDTSGVRQVVAGNGHDRAIRADWRQQPLLDLISLEVSEVLFSPFEITTCGEFADWVDSDGAEAVSQQIAEHGPKPAAIAAALEILKTVQERKLATKVQVDDDLGNEIKREEVLQVFAKRKALKSWVTDLWRLKREISQDSARDLCAYINLQEAASLLSQLVQILRSAEPYCICPPSLKDPPYADIGWITKLQHETLPEDSRWKASSAITKKKRSPRRKKRSTNTDPPCS